MILRRPLFLLAATLLFSGCYQLQPSQGGGQTDFQAPRLVVAEDVAVPDGYRIEVVATGLTFPTGVAFDGEGVPHVVEAGYSYGEVFTVPRVVRIDGSGRHAVIAEGANPPWNGIAFHDGAFFVAGGHTEGGQVLRITPDGTITPLLTGLPSYGDHHTNGPVIGPDSRLYFGQGTATNSGVVGVDNYHYGWLPRNPSFHDIPCEEVVLTGQNFTTANPLAVSSEEVTTGAFSPFGTRTEPGQRVEGQVPCSGAVFRLPPGGGEPELVAWGFRNPFGLAFGPDGELYVTDNAYDDRGSRPAWGAPDVLWRVEEGRWYGFPDFGAGIPISALEPPDDPAPPPLLEKSPGEVPEPLARLGVHSSSNGLDVSRSTAFGYEGHVFIAQFGDLAPEVGKVLAPVGFRVVRVEPADGVVHGFAANRGGQTGPASALGTSGFERPVAVRFDPSGEALYVVDFGVMTVGPQGPEPRPGTGVLWRITPEGAP